VAPPHQRYYCQSSSGGGGKKKSDSFSRLPFSGNRGGGPKSSSVKLTRWSFSSGEEGEGSFISCPSDLMRELTRRRNDDHAECPSSSPDFALPHRGRKKGGGYAATFVRILPILRKKLGADFSNFPPLLGKEGGKKGGSLAIRRY